MASCLPAMLVVRVNNSTQTLVVNQLVTDKPCLAELITAGKQNNVFSVGYRDNFTFSLYDAIGFV